MRSRKIGLKAFYTPQECHVWRVRGAPAGEGDPDVKHVLRFCLEREETQRKMLRAAGTRDFEMLLTASGS